MLARFEDDILAHRPDWLFLSAGVVEVRRIYQPNREQERVPVDEYAANLAAMTNMALNSNIQVVLLEPTPHLHPVTDGPPNVMVEDVNDLTRQYARAMMQSAQNLGVGFVPLFDAFLAMEYRLAGEASLYADEVHLGPLGDLLYSQLVFQYLEAS
jgi:hypothetical protein